MADEERRGGRGFYQRGGGWHADEVALAHVAAAAPTPCYVYSQAALIDSYQRLKTAFCHSRPQLCYAVKSNDNLALLKLLVQQGAGFDIVSAGELQRVLAAGAAAADVVFSGVGKRVEEIDAALAAGIGCFNVESEEELARIEQRAALSGGIVPVALRLTLDIDGGTHRHLATGLAGGKFGVSAADGRRLARVAAQSSHLQLLGFSCHIGSQVAEESSYLQLAAAMAAEVARAEADGIDIARVDMGGGFAVDYTQVMPPLMPLAAYDRALAAYFDGRQLLIEPGRSIVAAAGVLLTRVEYVKSAAGKTFWVVDAGMTTLLRPALYDAYHPILPLQEGAAPVRCGDVVGPICESADILAHDRELALEAGDVAAIFNAGAYGMVMASNYNAQPRPGAVLTAAGRWRWIRRPETMQDMLMFERDAALTG